MSSLKSSMSSQKKNKNRAAKARGVSTGSQQRAFLIILSLSGLLVIYTVYDYLTPAIMGFIIAGAFYPLLNLLMRKTGLSRKVSSMILSVFILLVITLPFIYIITQLAKEVFGIYNFIQGEGGSDFIGNILFGDHAFAGGLKSTLGYFGIEFTPVEVEKWINASLKSGLVLALDSLNALLSNLLQFLFSLLLMQILIYAIFLEGPSLKVYFLKLFPLKDEHEERIIDTVNKMNFATLVFNGIGGVIQGGLAGIGFWIAGFESLTLWTTTMIVLAFIPLVGISVISVPASLYLFFQGQTTAAIILFIYCTVVSLVTENWFKPLFMGKHVSMNSFLMFFSIIGGMSAFGIIGIFYGPLIIAVFLTITDIYFKYLDEKLPT
ncbi:MAG: AI-2E family transporter [Leptospirales bacterium]